MILWSKKVDGWDGFRPRRYTLDPRVMDLPIVLREVRPDDRDLAVRLEELKRGEFTPSKATESTVGEVVRQMLNCKSFSFEEPDRITLDGVTNSFAGPLSAGSAFAKDVLRVYAATYANTRSLDFALYYFDQDEVRDDPHQMFSFFVVQGDRILDWTANFSDAPGQDFDPTALLHDADSPSVWSNADDLADATAAWWYRRFYRETKMGQLMVLRPDRPPLFFFPEGRDELDRPVLVQLVALERRFRRLTVAAGLMGLAILMIAVKLWWR